MNGGDRIAAALAQHGVPVLFTLCGGHISPILVGAKGRGIRVVDVRDEATAVFAADAVGRLTGVPGVAAVTAGPGVTNALTAVKNAQLAQSPVVLLGGAAPTVLKGRGALQDIDQLALLEPAVKWAVRPRRVRELVPAVHQAFRKAREGVPGPVFVECPADLLYGERLVRESYGLSRDPAPGFGARLERWYLERHLRRMFAPGREASEPARPAARSEASRGRISAATRYVSRSERPVLVVGSQAAFSPRDMPQVAEALGELGIPVYLTGMARGLLGPSHPLLFRHKRREALKEADLVILAGAPCDFRLDYGRQINRRAALISINVNARELRKNRRPTVAIRAVPSIRVIRDLSTAAGGRERWSDWRARLEERDRRRATEIERLAAEDTPYVNPVALCRAIDGALDPDSVLVGDGGDFVATAAYAVSPRGPLTWLDAGVFGTLGAGAGLAMGAKLCRPAAEVWVLYGDGSAAFSLAEFDTFVRHGLPVIAVVGNDAGWMQIARGQIAMLQDDVATVLRRSDYHQVAEGYGGKGFLVERQEDLQETLQQAKAVARNGTPVLVNVFMGTSGFRAGSISM